MIPIKQLFKKINGVIQPIYPITNEKAIFDGGGRKLSEKLQTYEENLSDAFSEEKTYATGDYVIYQNRLYKFTSAKEAGAFDGTKVVPCSVIGEMNNKLSNHELFDTYANVVAFGVNSHIDTNSIVIPSNGHYICDLAFAFCGADNITVANAYVMATMYINGEYTSILGTRNAVNIPISKSWDNNNKVTFIRYFNKGETVVIRFTNYTESVSNGTYGSTGYFLGVKL